MKKVILSVVWISPKNPKFAILAPIIKIKVGNREIVNRGQGGFLESDTNWELGEGIELGTDQFQITKKITKEGTELPVIELIA